ncbi:hypothetical protein OF83DRAFT_1157836 [Amylostereum chailletii]|nr:hypothetical protein OF83DRAFT_1157836 [Amylostereum chailletii]
MASCLGGREHPCSAPKQLILILCLQFLRGGQLTSISSFGRTLTWFFCQTSVSDAHDHPCVHCSGKARGIKGIVLLGGLLQTRSPQRKAMRCSTCLATPQMHPSTRAYNAPPGVLGIRRPTLISLSAVPHHPPLARALDRLMSGTVEWRSPPVSPPGMPEPWRLYDSPSFLVPNEYGSPVMDYTPSPRPEPTTAPASNQVRDLRSDEPALYQGESTYPLAPISSSSLASGARVEGNYPTDGVSVSQRESRCNCCIVM